MLLGIFVLAGCSGPPASDVEMISTPYMQTPSVAMSEAEYRSAVDGIATRVNASLGAFASAMRSRDGQAAMQALDGLVDARNTAANLAPPADLADTHERLMQSLDGYCQFARQMGIALSSTDGNEVRRLTDSSQETLKTSSRLFQATLESLDP